MSAGTDSIAMVAAAWLVTYLMHSTVWLGNAWVLTRFLRAAAVREWAWRVAVCGGLVTASLFGRLGFDPVISITAPLSAPAVERAAQPARAVSVGIVGAAAQPAVPPPAVRAEPAATFLSELRWYHAVSVLWALGALVGLGHLAFLHLRLRRALADRHDVEHADLLAALERLRALAAFRTPVRLTCHLGLGSPIALGRSEICVPALALERLGRPERAAMLAHELAHLERRDPLWLRALAVLEHALFLQPLNRVASAHLAETAEELTDERAVHWTGDPAALARCLGEVASWPGERPALASTMVRASSPLVSRVRRVLSGAAPASSRAERLVLGVLAAGALALLACQGPGLAAEPAPDEPFEPVELRIVVPVARGVVVDEIEALEEANRTENAGRFDPEAFGRTLREWVAEQIAAAPDAPSADVFSGTLRIDENGAVFTLMQSGAVTAGLRVSLPQDDEVEPSAKPGMGVAKLGAEDPPSVIEVFADGSVRTMFQTPVKGVPGLTMVTGTRGSVGEGFAEHIHGVLKLAAESMPKGRLVEGDDSSPEVPMGRVVLRVDGSADFATVLAILDACGAEDVRIWNIAFELPAEDSDSKEVATPLPRDLEDIPETVEEGRIAAAPARFELRIDVAKAGDRVDVESGEPWSGAGPFRFEGRSVSYEFAASPWTRSSPAGDTTTIGTVRMSADSPESAAARLELFVECATDSLTIDARPGTVYADLAEVVAAARDLGFEVLFVAHRGDK